MQSHGAMESELSICIIRGLLELAETEDNSRLGLDYLPVSTLKSLEAT